MDLEVNAQDELGTQKLRSPPIDMLTHKHVVRSVEELEDYSAPCEVDTAESSEKTYQLEGRRILNLKTFYSKLQEVSSHGPFNCGLGSVEIVSEKQTGYQSTFTLQCKLCNMKFFISSDEGSEMNINNCAVLGTVAIGCGHSQLQELSASLDLPSISFSMYQKCHENISNMWEGISLKTMTDAAKEEREIALLQGRIDENGVPIIDVIVDGCWSKRSYRKNYSALSGAAVIIGKKTGKILFIGIKNKYCCICAQAEYKKVLPREHKCFKNYTGPSTGMESSILVEGFKCSIDMHGLIYGRMISDGDSATYSKIIETRPYCNTTVQKIRDPIYIEKAVEESANKKKLPKKKKTK
ncbi:unnamed protein product [Parnassius apollo]|uniref:(apollo) hypothetical protein n=1 Tax=Parnassius apollo TaxID=110799 RepID=A0A8S3VY52_PARAO|nr:unnamed protein product [Parnassius apollo]